MSSYFRSITAPRVYHVSDTIFNPSAQKVSDLTKAEKEELALYKQEDDIVRPMLLDWMKKQGNDVKLKKKLYSQTSGLTEKEIDELLGYAKEDEENREERDKFFEQQYKDRDYDSMIKQKIGENMSPNPNTGKGGKTKTKRKRRSRRHMKKSKSKRHNKRTNKRW